jgi:putative hydrolase of HD superfamily
MLKPLMTKHDLDNLHRTLARAANLKQVKRAGWLRCGVDAAACESVADHTFGVALLALLLPRVATPDLDRDRCVRLALVHDLAESVVGDITPHDHIDPADKHRREGQAIRELCATLGGDDELLALWLEFEAGETAEAKVVRELDVIEMAMQARRYERTGMLTRDDAEQFIASARRRVQSETGRALLATATALTTAPLNPTTTAPPTPPPTPPGP